MEYTTDVGSRLAPAGAMQEQLIICHVHLDVVNATGGFMLHCLSQSMAHPLERQTPEMSGDGSTALGLPSLSKGEA
jgi:hypothetical protein